MKSSEKKVVLPELGEGVLSGELVRWHVQKGQQVGMDDPLAEIMTDKAAMEVPSPYEGVVKNLMAKEGQTLKVGEVLLTLSIQGEAKAPQKNTEDNKPLMETIPDKTIRQVPSPSDEGVVKNPVAKQEEESLLEGGGVLATPFTRRLAKNLKVDLKNVKGTGLAGRVTKEDLEKHAPASPLNSKQKTPLSVAVSGVSVPFEEGQKRIPLKGIRKKIAEKMQLSKSLIPHFTLTDSANMEELDRIRNSINDSLKEKPGRVTYLTFAMKALLKTVVKFETLNAAIDDQNSQIVLKKYYHFGFAADTPRGLLVPVVKNVDKKSLTDLSLEIKTLAQKAREGRITHEEMSGGTITITNIGSIGGHFATPIINTPETSILGMYRLSVQPEWDGRAFQPQKTMNFSLTCDHRLIDGAVAAHALKFFIHQMENPFALFM